MLACIERKSNYKNLWSLVLNIFCFINVLFMLNYEYTEWQNP